MRKDAFEMSTLFILLAFGGLLIVASSGCATIVSGTTQKLNFQSNPSGATVSINGTPVGTTPLSATVKRNQYAAIGFSKDGYETYDLQLKRGMNGWFWGNILFGGLIGSTTDGMSGSMNQFSPSDFLVTLQPKATTSIDAASAMTKSQKVKKFIVTNDADLRSDLHKEHGDFLSSLLQLLEIPEEEQPAAVKKMKVLSETDSNVLLFADAIVGTYIKAD